MKYAAERPYADPEKAARRILEIANAVVGLKHRDDRFGIRLLLVERDLKVFGSALS